jgi:hypothetical protein
MMRSLSYLNIRCLEKIQRGTNSISKYSFSKYLAENERSVFVLVWDNTADGDHH